MRHWFLCLTAALVCASVAAADEKAEAIVKKAIEAHGGAEALNKFKAGKFNMEGEMTILGEDLKYTAKVAYMIPDRYRFNLECTIAGEKMVVEQIMRGDKIRSKTTLGDMTLPPEEDEKDEMKLSAALQDAEQLTPLLDAKKFELKAGDEEDVKGAKAATVIITIKALKKEVKFSFDKKTGLLVKTAHKTKAPDEDGDLIEVLEEAVQSDFKKVNGVQVATKMTVTHDGKKFMTGTLSDIQLFEKLEDKEFPVED